ncbi:MAG: hypothetical protein HY868_21695 [Chloroflexi bacterium]|nr:hypothetical protein [Chloroflexota bacterium]
MSATPKRWKWIQVCILLAYMIPAIFSNVPVMAAGTPTATMTQAPTVARTIITVAAIASPSATPTAIATSTRTKTSAPVSTSTPTAIATNTRTKTSVPASTSTTAATKTNTPATIHTATASQTSPAATNTPTETPTAVETETIIDLPTATPVATVSGTIIDLTDTSDKEPTATPIPSAAPTVTRTPVAVPTHLAVWWYRFFKPSPVAKSNYPTITPVKRLVGTTITPSMALGKGTTVATPSSLFGLSPTKPDAQTTRIAIAPQGQAQPDQPFDEEMQTSPEMAEDYPEEDPANSADYAVRLISLVSVGLSGILGFAGITLSAAAVFMFLRRYLHR